MADLDNIFVSQTAEEIYSMFLEDLPAPTGGGDWNTRPGSVIHAILQPLVLERLRLISYAQDALEQGFLQFAGGAALDAKAAEFGITRGTATASLTTLQFSGTPGTLVPLGSSVSSVGDSISGDPGIEFTTLGNATVGAGGTVTVGAQSVQTGTRANVDSGTVIIMQSALSGITAVTNTTDATGGTDEQSDAELRTAALVRAAIIPASGNKATYTAYALARSDIGDAYVEDLWLGNGTGRLVVVGLTPNVHVPAATVHSLQAAIDPSVNCISHMEGETWVSPSSGVLTNDTTTPLEGEASIQIASPQATDNWIRRQVTLDLSAWNSTSDEIRLEVRRDSASATLNNLKLALLSPTSPVDVKDEFFTDSLTAGTYVVDAGAGTVSVDLTNHNLVPSTTANKRLIYSPTTFTHGDMRSCWIKHTTGATVSGYEAGVILKRIDASNYIKAYLSSATVRIDKVVAGVTTNLVSTGAVPSTNTTYWLNAKMVGNVVTVEHWTTPPSSVGTPSATTNWTLGGGDATQFGTGVRADVGIQWVPADTNCRIDDFTVDPEIDGAETTISAATINALGTSTGKGMLQIPRSSFTSYGSGLDWSKVGYFRFKLSSALASGTCAVTVDALRIADSNGGSGTGLAPIGIQMTVRSAAKTSIDVAATVTPITGITISDIIDGLKSAIAQALVDAQASALAVRLSTVANAIHDYPGVLDYSNVQLARTGATLTAANVTLSSYEIPRAGTITIS